MHSILSERAYIVESDVANYFSSIDLHIVQEYLLRSDLHRDVVRLVLHLIKNVLRHLQYAEYPGMGLPQEQIDSSRHIAHGLLVEVDRDFDALGELGLYGRFMDDFAIGAESIQEAQEQIATLQKGLDRLGLYPNSAKTRIFDAATYRTRIMADENAYREEVESQLVEVKVSGLRSRSFADEANHDEFLSRAAAFRELEDQPAQWERVLRRYYRYLKEIGRDDWLQYVASDLSDFPDGSSHFLEYARSFPLTPTLAADLLGLTTSSSRLYGDLPLLLLETIATAPNSGEPDLLSQVLDGAKALSAAVLATPLVPKSGYDWILAYLSPIVAKFGDEDQVRSWLDSLHLESLPVQSVSRLHAVPLQVTTGVDARSVFASELAGLSWSSVLTLDFIRALEDGDSKARGVALGLCTADIRLLPNRSQFHVRSISLARILGRTPTKQLGKALTRTVGRLAANPAHLVDQRTISILEEVSSSCP